MGVLSDMDDIMTGRIREEFIGTDNATPMAAIDESCRDIAARLFPAITDIDELEALAPGAGIFNGTHLFRTVSGFFLAASGQWHDPEDVDLPAVLVHDPGTAPEILDAARERLRQQEAAELRAAARRLEAMH